LAAQAEDLAVPEAAASAFPLVVASEGASPGEASSFDNPKGKEKKKMTTI